MVREVGLGILRGDSGQQEGPPLLANTVMVVWPVGWRCLHNKDAYVEPLLTDRNGACFD